MPTTNDTQLKFQEAIDFLADKLNLDTDSWIEGQGLVQQVAFTVAGAKGSLLQDIRDAVDLAINDGISIADFAKRFDFIAESYVDNWTLKGDRAWRSQLIYEQNMRSSYAAGRRAQMTEPSVLKSRPYWQYRHGDTRQPRPTHLAMNNKVFLADTLPCALPAGFGCKCTLFSLSQRDVDREGLTVEDVSDFEADKGFNYLPGKLTKERREELLKGLDPDIRKLVLGDGNEVEFKLPEGTTRRRNGVNYVLQGSRWHRSEVQETPRKNPRIARASDIYELTSKFETEIQELRDAIQSETDADKLRVLWDQKTYDSIGDRFIHGLMQLGDRDLAEERAAKIDKYGMAGAQLHNQATRDAADFYQLIDRDLGIEKISPSGDPRACAKLAENWVNLPNEQPLKDRRWVQFHEMAHFAEFRDPEAGKLAEDWVKGRAEGVSVPLSQLTGNPGYRDDEVALPDNFIAPYVGKLYGHGITEVHSMGLQAFASGRMITDLYKRDPEHFQLMMNYIRK
jgi:hypothetical protein